MPFENIPDVLAEALAAAAVDALKRDCRVFVTAALNMPQVTQRISNILFRTPFVFPFEKFRFIFAGKSNILYLGIGKGVHATHLTFYSRSFSIVQDCSFLSWGKLLRPEIYEWFFERQILPVALDRYDSNSVSSRKMKSTPPLWTTRDLIVSNPSLGGRI